jgi:hypothetical protein
MTTPLLTTKPHIPSGRHRERVVPGARLIELAGQHRFAFELVPHGQSLKPCYPALAQMYNSGAFITAAR